MYRRCGRICCQMWGDDQNIRHLSGTLRPVKRQGASVASKGILYRIRINREDERKKKTLSNLFFRWSDIADLRSLR